MGFLTWVQGRQEARPEDGHRPDPSIPAPTSPPPKPNDIPTLRHVEGVVSAERYHELRGDLAVERRLHAAARSELADELREAKADGERVQRQRHILTCALEEIALFAPGRAGATAAEALVEVGVWVDTVEISERPSDLESWLRAGAPLPAHDPPLDFHHLTLSQMEWWPTNWTTLPRD